MNSYIDPRKVFESCIARSMGFDRYHQIMDMVRKTDISSDSTFQHDFNVFYVVRRNEGWRKDFYDLFESIKDSNPTFEHIIRSLYKATGYIEASFSSKMLATINADMPIWDHYVIQNLGLKVTGKTKEERLECAISIYGQMVSWYNDFLQTENAKECIAEFDRILPGYTWISDVKKIDFYLWSIRN